MEMQATRANDYMTSLLDTFKTWQAEICKAYWSGQMHWLEYGCVRQDQPQTHHARLASCDMHTKTFALTGHVATCNFSMQLFLNYVVDLPAWSEEVELYSHEYNVVH